MPAPEELIKRVQERVLHFESSQLSLTEAETRKALIDPIFEAIEAFHIRRLDFGVMSCGDTIEECKENVKEAIEIYLEDLPEGQSVFKPSPPEYWRMFLERRN